MASEFTKIEFLNFVYTPQSIKIPNLLNVNINEIHIENCFLGPAMATQILEGKMNPKILKLQSTDIHTL